MAAEEEVGQDQRQRHLPPVMNGLDRGGGGGGVIFRAAGRRGGQDLREARCSDCRRISLKRRRDIVHEEQITTDTGNLLSRANKKRSSASVGGVKNLKLDLSSLSVLSFLPFC